jgi:hypothetical protein
MNADASSGLRRWQRVALVLVFAALICLHLPGPLIHGRLWAEEGSKFYQNAATLPWHQALLAPWGGYLNLVANAAPILARHMVRLEYVPWISTGIALAFQCCPAVVLAFSRDPWLASPLVRLTALLLVVTAPVTQEVYLQSLHSQFHLTLSCALILALEVPSGWLAPFYGAVLFLAPLCGPAACLLAPLFCARALIDRSRRRAIQAAIIVVAAALQYFLFYAPLALRGGGVAPLLLLRIVYFKHLVTPFLGHAAAQAASVALRARMAAQQFPWRALIVTLTAAALFGLALLRRRLAAATWMVLFACLLAPVAYNNALVGGPLLLIVGVGARYAFVPEVLLSLALLGIATGTVRPERWLARGLVAWLLVMGLLDLVRPPPFFNEGPSWSREVALWRADHTHRILLWPGTWFMTLDHE